MSTRTSSELEDDDKQRTPIPAPRKSSKNKPTISAPFDFRHVIHFGLHSPSFDDGKTIESLSKIDEVDHRPQEPTMEHDEGEHKTASAMRRLDDTSISDDDLEKLGAAALHVPEWSSEVLENKDPAKVETKSCTCKTSHAPAESNENSRLREDTMPKVDVSWHQKVSNVQHDARSARRASENVVESRNAMTPKQSRKKNPAPPPPSETQSSSTEPHPIRDENVAWKPHVSSSPPKPQNAHVIKTSDKVEQHCAVSSTVNRPNVLGDMKNNQEHVVPSPSSSRAPATPAASLRNADGKPMQRLPPWMIDMPVKEQKRLSGVWLQVMGETEMPDDRRTVMETVAKFEAQSRLVSPNRRAVPRRVAPPPPIDQILKRAVELEEKMRNHEDTCTKNKERSSGSSDSVSPREVASAASTPAEKLDSTTANHPIPKPRQKKSLDNPSEECVETVCIGTPMLILPETMASTECVVALSKPCVNIRTEATCVLKKCSKNPKDETEITVEEMQNVSTMEANGKAQTDDDTPSDEDVETIRL